MKEKVKVPELRFDGFTDDWEERKLGDIFVYKQGQQVPVENQFTKRGKNRHRFIRIVDLTTNNEAPRYIEYSGDNIISSTDLFMIRYGQPGVIGYGYEGVIANNLFKLIPKIETYNLFFKYILDSMYPKIQSLSSSTTMPAISFKSLDVLAVRYPDKKEQEKIGSFFAQLDNTIALHQRKLDLLKEQKKGYLQKMFPKNGAKVPELRFAGFADDWEERKLSSIAERVTRKNKNNESTLPLTISAQDGLVDQNDYFNKQVASRDVTGYFLVKNGEFAYNKSYSNGYPWGAIKRLDKYEMGVLSTLYIVFKPTAINSQFLVSYYETTRWYREVSKNAAEGARNHGLLNISPNDFFNTSLTIPKSAEEQQQIGSFFKQLDDTIALHQRKLDLLKEQKKGYLQKMFV
ncbi:restriction endonuclease subunit S [Lactococcus lactis]|uniref:restriction endonuclease subunit S n=1 Tax=Lactococcus lactis TaxID=1358 RepID=UPI001C1FF1E9|nr:restriction endonuclease subunit S [Lactococcus lactis]MBU7541780.1 restriction endonuclease subunit S [Lactococcus lactis]